MLKLILFTDGSAASRHAVEYIAPITRESDVDVTVLTALNDSARAAELFSKTASQLGATVVKHLEGKPPADNALLDAVAAGDYDLAVFGPMPERWARWMRFRPRHALSAELACSSLLVRGTAKGITRVLICAGGDETVIEDARLTVRLARRAGATATVLHVLSQMPMLFGVRTPQERATEAFAKTGSPEIANMHAAVDVLRAGGVDAAIKVRIGLVIDEIVAELEGGGYDLLVIGAHRSQGLVERLLLEDVTADILGHSPVPVLVVKAMPDR